MALTLYFAFAFPIDLFRVRQTDTTIIKSVQILVRHGEKAPSPESYFLEEKENLVEPADGFGQLTNAGKKRMYSLGKFLKLKYYDLLLDGNPNKIYARSSDADRCIESASVLVSGLNPPKDKWIWSDEISNWQPIAIHSVPETEDDLLYPYAPCPEADAEEERIRNSSIYSQYLTEYRHDLQTLYEYTGNDKVIHDLAQAELINDALKTRQGMPMASVPEWYTPAFAKRLAHIVDKTDQIRFSTTNIQRLRAGRLLNEIIYNIKAQSGRGTVSSNREDRRKVQVYVTHDQPLIALMNSLQIYTGIPNYGTALIIELHYDPVNLINFLRFFIISSHHPDVIPEPVRVNPPICGVNPECDTLQFEQNVQHLAIDRKLWHQACRTPQIQPISPIIVSPTSANQDHAIVAPQLSNATDSNLEGNSIVPDNSGTNSTGGRPFGPLPLDMNGGDNYDTIFTTPTSNSSEPSLNEKTTPKFDQQPIAPVTPITPISTNTISENSAISEQPMPIKYPGVKNETNTGTEVISPTTTISEEAIEKEKSSSVGGADTNKLESHDSMDNSIYAVPMFKNLIQNGLDTSIPSNSKGTRLGPATTRDVYVPMEVNKLADPNQKYKISEGLDDF